MVLKTHLEPFREPLKVPPVGQPNNPFSKSDSCDQHSNLFAFCILYIRNTLDDKVEWIMLTTVESRNDIHSSLVSEEKKNWALTLSHKMCP